MNILHIANSYGGTEVYRRLFVGLDSLGCRQQIFVALNHRNHDRIGKQAIAFSVDGSALHYSTRLKWWHKFCYRQKIKAIVGALEEAIDMSKIDIIHAHMLCVDGAVARELSLRYAKPYVTTVRNTDLNTYFKWFPWERGAFLEILDSASHVVFLGPKYRRKLAEHCSNHGFRERLFSNSSIIPSGVDPVFLKRRHVHGMSAHKPLKLVFVGAFYEGKGLQETILAGDILRDQGIEIELTAIGRGLPHRPNDRPYIERVENLAAQRPWVHLKNYMSHEELVDELRENDVFVMPSSPESFGLVYVEALSQGLPVIYTKGEGFDGYYAEGEVGWAADARNPAEIAGKVELVLKDYAGFAGRVGRLDLEHAFSWPLISEQYDRLYSSILGNAK